MNSTTAALHAGLLARKGEAKPSAQTEPAGISRGNVTSFTDALIRRSPAANEGKDTGRRIELPRQHAAPATRRRNTGIMRHQLHARVSPELHLRMRIAAARGGRTQQDLVSSALEAYLSFLDEDVYSPPCGARNARV
jgi:hypothetical protein